MLKLKQNKARLNILLLGLLTGAAMFTLSFFVDSLSTNSISSSNIRKIERILHRKQTMLENIAHSWLDSVSGSSINIFSENKELTKLEKSKTLFLFGLKNDSIVYWSSNIPVSKEQLLSIDTIARFVKLGNTWQNTEKSSEGEGTYVAQGYVSGDYKAISLILISTEYTYQNAFLKSGLNPQLPFPPFSYVSMLSDGGVPIHGKDHLPIFNVGLDTVTRHSPYTLPLRWLGWLLILSILTSFAAQANFGRYTALSLLLFLLVLFSGWLYISRNIKLFEDGWLLFSPQLFASSDLHPSLGHLLLDAFLLFLFTTVLYRQRRNISAHIKRLNRKTVWIVAFSLSAAFSSIIAILAHRSFISLIINSNIPLEPYKLSDVNLYTLFAYIIISLMLGSIFLIQLYYVELATSTKKKFLPALPICMVILAMLFADISATNVIIFLLFHSLAYLATSYHLFDKLSKVKYLAGIVLLASLYTITIVAIETAKKEKTERQVLAMNLTTERDPVAEVLFKELSTDITNDLVIASKLKDTIDSEFIMQHLQSRYFNGYFKRYDFTLTICPKGGNLHLLEENREVDCWSFFNSMAKNTEEAATGKFTFLDINNGRINYLGRFIYNENEDNEAIGVFIVLSSRLENQLVGYPELLINSIGNVGTSSLSKSYAYAKYLDGNMVSSFGEYGYGYELSTDKDSNQPGSSTYTANGYSHLRVNYDNHNSIIISLSEINLSDLILSFSYVFLLFLITISLLLFIGGYRFTLVDRRITFRQRITNMLITLLFILFASTCASMLWYNMRQFDKNNIDNIEERMKMLLAEFDRLFIDKESFEEQNFVDLSYLLAELSNIYYTDINIYSPGGKLIATSRPEIFDKGLQGEQINPSAYRTLRYGNLSRYVCRESIGSMTFYSAYTSYYNNNNQLLGFINLPLFAKQAELKKELTSLIIAILNIFMLLNVLGVIIAIAISNRLTRPLEAVRASMSKLNLSGHSEPISYNGKDELGDLVREYNRTIKELERSAQQLAKTERESAWREMARQIAHEIKNPLTPMRLSIQHVWRMKKDGVEGWQSKFDNLAKTLIEQIDTLSDTASEFSNFAKLSTTDNSIVDISELLYEQVSLFAGYENINITLHNDMGSINVSAHREQLQRVFTNIMKNAVQAVGDRKNGRIDIYVKEKEKNYRISIEDNGMGISAKQQKNLFVPNFTTKSGGTGLGLAISKNIVENFGGSIEFKPAENGGACFTVVLPKVGEKS